MLNAYAATDPAPDSQANWSPAWADLFEPTGAGQPLPDAAPEPLRTARAEAEQSILANLLRLNAERAG